MTTARDTDQIETQTISEGITSANSAERQQAEDDRIEAYARTLRAIVESFHDAIVGKDLNGIITTWNVGAERLFGYTAGEIIGRPITTIIPPDRQHEEVEILTRLRSGELIDHFDTVRQHKDGSLIDISLTVSPIRDAQGRIIGACKIARDITARKRQADHLAFLMREMSHRTNNLLTIIQAIARQTAQSSDSYDGFLTKFNARIQGLAYSNQLLMQQNWTGASLGELVRLQLQPFVEPGSSRIEIEGPHVMLAVNSVQSIGLVLHELATNASKYGALSGSDGKVCIRWEIVDDGGQAHFRLVWHEREGPPVKAPSRRGFGSIVLEEMTRAALACKTEAQFATDGLCWILICPAGRILKGNGSSSA